MIKKKNASFGLNTNVHVDPAATANASPNITNHIYIRDFKKIKPDEKNGLREQSSLKDQRSVSALSLKEAKDNMNFNASAIAENNVMNRDVQIEGSEGTRAHNMSLEETNECNEVTDETHTTTTPVKKPQKIYAREVIITTESKQNEEQTVKPKTAEQVILETYAKILLDQNKSLLLNLISKKTIIVPRSDLEEIIKAKTGLKCEITLVDDEVGCCIAKYSPIKKIDTIKLIHEELVMDFKQTRNNDYNDLINLYHLCLKFCIDS